MSSIFASPEISDTESEWMSTRGYSAATRRKSCSNHSMRSSGFTPPWIMICVAPWSAAYFTRSSTLSCDMV